MSIRRRAHPGHLVHLIHGIRTHAAWQDRVTQILESVEGVEVCATRYGRFDLLSFLLPGPTRRPPIDKTLDDLMDSIGRAKKSKRQLTVIAHSYGSHAIHEILEAHPTLEIDNLILCGAIKGQECAWKKIKKTGVRGALINDYGTRDVWPAFAKAVTWGYGNGGTYGIGMPFEDRRHPFAHSDFFTDDFVMRYWLPFIAEGSVVPASYTPYPTHPWWFPLLDLPWRWIIVLVLGVLAVLSALAIADGTPAASPSGSRSTEASGPDIDPLNVFLDKASLSTPIGQFDLRLSMGEVSAYGIDNEELQAKAYTPLAKRHLLVAYSETLPVAVGYIGDDTDTRILGLSVGSEDGDTLDSTADMHFDKVYGSCRPGTLRIPGTDSFGRIYMSGCYFGNPGSYQTYGFIYGIPNAAFGEGCDLDPIELRNEGIPLKEIEDTLPHCAFFKATAIGYATMQNSEPPPVLIDSMLLTLSTSQDFLDDE